MAALRSICATLKRQRRNDRHRSEKLILESIGERDLKSSAQLTCTSVIGSIAKPVFASSHPVGVVIMVEKSVGFDESSIGVEAGQDGVNGTRRVVGNGRQAGHGDGDDGSRPEHHAHGGRLRRLIHPITGKIFHIVNHPQEVAALKLTLSRQAGDDTGNDDSDKFDVLIHGTDEHITAVRDIQKHHETQRDAIRAQNDDVVSRYEKVRSELDLLRDELHLLTDHAVSLDASFDKFGYSARIRTTGDHDAHSPSASSTNLSRSDSHGSTHSHKDHNDRSLVGIKFWKRPVVRQYFHKNLLWRSPQASEVSSFELFVDLVLVTVVDVLGEAAVTNASGASFLHYVIVFALAWKTWSDLTTFMNWFEVDDIISRVSICFYLVLLYAFTTNIANGFEETYTAGLSFYLTARFLTALWWVWVGYLIPMIRPTMFFQASITMAGAVIWIGSAHVPYPRNLPMIWVAIVLDLFGSAGIMPLIRILSWTFQRLKAMERLVEYLPAINIEHRIERMGAFVSLVFGYSVSTILYQSASKFPLDAFLGKGILALVQAFVFNWLYFEVDGWAIHVHAIRRSWVSTMVWTTAHLPFTAGYILAASSLRELVLAHDCSDANIEWLSDEYQSSSSGEVEPALRWFYCGGLGVALIHMSIISLCHVHKRIPSARLPKYPRLLIRLAIATAIICLPLADRGGEGSEGIDEGSSSNMPRIRLSSLDLIAITTSLTALVLMMDLYGNSCASSSFWTGGFCRTEMKNTTYEARCAVTKRRKRDMQRRFAQGETVTLDDVMDSKGMNDSVSSFGSGGLVNEDALHPTTPTTTTAKTKRKRRFGTNAGGHGDGAGTYV